MLIIGHPLCMPMQGKFDLGAHAECALTNMCHLLAPFFCSIASDITQKVDKGWHIFVAEHSASAPKSNLPFDG